MHSCRGKLPNLERGGQALSWDRVTDSVSFLAPLFSIIEPL